MSKSVEAFRTIGEVADELDVPKHVLRFWEGKFPHIRPMKRGGGRRYYRPEDMELLRGIRHLLHAEGYTIKGVQKILREQGIDQVKEAAAAATAALASANKNSKSRGRAAKRIAANDTAQQDLLPLSPVVARATIDTADVTPPVAANHQSKKAIIDSAIRELERCLEILSAKAPAESVAADDRAQPKLRASRS